MRHGQVILTAMVAALATPVGIGGVASAESPKIQTVFASYGYAMNRKDVKDDVKKYCDGKASCTFKVTNQNLDMHKPLDPSPGDDKGLLIGWKCGDKTQKYEFAEGKNANLSCQ